MNLDNRENYLREQALLQKLSLSKLTKFVAEMHKIRYEDNDIQVDSYYRLASHVLTQRTKVGGTLIFHMKNFLGTLVGWTILSTFII